ncbi:MAG: helix-turn-helix transcriptional regulator [Clostridiales bacterium]|nr:helix-turn-helix transcriptional regulator [Clostridiales bacterium]
MEDEGLLKIGTRIRMLRLKANKSLKEVSAETGISVKVLKSIEDGQREIDIKELLIFSSYYRISANYIVMGYDDAIKDIERKKRREEEQQRAKLIQ